MSKINRPAPAGLSYYTKPLPPKAIAAERRGGVSETNPDKHGRTFLVSVPLCLCVRIPTPPTKARSLYSASLYAAFSILSVTSWVHGAGRPNT